MVKRFFLVVCVVFFSSFIVESSEYSKAYVTASQAGWINQLLKVAKDSRKTINLKEVMSQHDFAVFSSEYFPGITIYSKSKELSLFDQISKKWGLGKPTFVALPNPGRDRVFKLERPINLRYINGMNRAWLLVWFAGSDNWHNIDIPVLIILQKSIKNIDSKKGFTLKFDGEAGFVTVMNLYGYHKSPQHTEEGMKFLNKSYRFPEKKVVEFKTVLGKYSPLNTSPTEWGLILPENVSQRCDFFAQVVRALPYALKDSFQVDTKNNVLRLKYNYQYLETTDDWATVPIRFAPIPPTVALGKKYGLPIEISGNYIDPIYPTALGPWSGVKLKLGEESCTVDIKLLQYITETWKPELSSDTSSPLVKKSIEILTKEVPKYCTNQGPNGDLTSYYSPTGEKPKGFAWDVITSHQAKALAIHYVPEDKKSDAKMNMNSLLRFSYFTPKGYTKKIVGGRKYYFRTDIGSGDKIDGRAGQLIMNQFQVAWEYAYRSKDYGWAKRTLVPMVRTANFVNQLSWARGGRRGGVEIADGPGPLIAYTRLMYLTRNQKGFAWGAYASIMELLQLFAKTGAIVQYAKGFQPWHSEQFIGKNDCALKIGEQTMGWQFSDALNFGKKPSKLLNEKTDAFLTSENPGILTRWRGYIAPDVQRFLKEQCVKEEWGVEREFNAWGKTFFRRLKKGRLLSTSKNPFINPIYLATLYRGILGMNDRELRRLFNGYDFSEKEMEDGRWKWGVTPWMAWTMPLKKTYERIMKKEVYPWTPGLRSIYLSPKTDLVYNTAAFDKKEKGQAVPVSLDMGYWKSGKKERRLNLGYITPHAGATPKSVKKIGPIWVYDY